MPADDEPSRSPGPASAWIRPDPDIPEAREGEARAERLRIAYSHLPMIVGASLVSVLVSTLVVHGRVPDARLAAWSASSVAISVVRLALHRAFGKGPDTADGVRRWTWLLGLAMTVAGAIFGSLVLLPVGRPDLVMMTTSVITLASLVAGGAQSLVGTPWVLAVSSTAACLPLAVELAIAEDASVRPFAALVPLYALTTLGVGQRNWRALNAAIALRFQNLEIANLLARRSAAADEERTRSLAERREKNRFLAAASHDLRQPIHALRLVVAVLREEDLSERGRRMVAGAEAALRPISELVDGMLELSRIEAGAVDPILTRVEAADLAADLSAMFEPIATERGIGLHVAFRRGLVVQTDQALFSRMVQNLVGNALRYTRKGRVLVAFRTRGTSVVVQVWDTGPGIPESELEEVFLPFRRLDHAGGGVGLGLAIVRGLAVVLGVRCSVRSRVGAGSVFELEVPRGDVGALATTTPAVPARAEPERTPTLLIVDDDPLVREGLAALADHWGYRTLAAASADQVARHIEQGAVVDGAVVDWNLGSDTGASVLELLELATGSAPPTLIVTGASDTATLATLRAAGHPVLSKPAAPEALRAAIESLVGSSHVSSTARRSPSPNPPKFMQPESRTWSSRQK